MIERVALLGGDVQSRRPLTQLSLSRVGVTGVEKVAERHGLLGELRREVNFGERARRDVTKREWLEDVPRPEKA